MRNLVRNSPAARHARCRSEEHTSELQSRLHLVCRLLLEKKNIRKPMVPHPPPASASRACTTLVLLIYDQVPCYHAIVLVQFLSMSRGYFPPAVRQSVVT